MTLKNHWKTKINESLKKLSALPVVLLMSLVLTACTSARTKNVEVWLIDEEDVVLYRVISDTKEQAIPIKGNPAMKQFMCMHEDYFYSLVESMTNADPE